MDVKINIVEQSFWWNSKQGYGRGNFNFDHYKKVLEAKENQLRNEQERNIRTDTKIH